MPVVRIGENLPQFERRNRKDNSIPRRLDQSDGKLECSSAEDAPGSTDLFGSVVADATGTTGTAAARQKAASVSLRTAEDSDDVDEAVKGLSLVERAAVRIAAADQRRDEEVCLVAGLDGSGLLSEDLEVVRALALVDDVDADVVAARDVRPDLDQAVVRRSRSEDAHPEIAVVLDDENREVPRRLGRLGAGEGARGEGQRSGGGDEDRPGQRVTVGDPSHVSRPNVIRRQGRLTLGRSRPARCSALTIIFI